MPGVLNTPGRTTKTVLSYKIWKKSSSGFFHNSQLTTHNYPTGTPDR